MENFGIFNLLSQLLKQSMENNETPPPENTEKQQPSAGTEEQPAAASVRNSVKQPDKTQYNKQNAYINSVREHNEIVRRLRNGNK